MDEEINAIERNNTWEWFDILKEAQPIDKNSSKKRLVTKIAKNPMSNKSIKVRTS